MLCSAGLVQMEVAIKRLLQRPETGFDDTVMCLIKLMIPQYKW